MEKCKKISLLCLIFFLIVLCRSAMAELQVDVQGNYEWTKYNFTDREKPYEHIDGWGEIKLSYWFDENKAISPFLAIIPSTTSADRFWWQRNIEMQIGLQWYPFFRPDDNRFLKSIRFFAMYAKKKYYDQESTARDGEDEDVEIGLDYYYDNLFEDSFWTAVVWSKLSFQNTNWDNSLDYDAVTWGLDAKFGPKFDIGDSILYPYALVESLMTSTHQIRWWENYVRGGAGVRYYPKAYGNKSNMLGDFFKRFHIYAEVVENFGWIRNDAPAVVEDTDYRLGVGFSTSGYTRDVE